MRTLPLLITPFLAAAIAGQDVLRVRGVVVDEDDRPLAGVAVCAFASSEPFTTAELAARPAARTAADGSFGLEWNALQRPPLDGVLFVAEGRVHVAAGAWYVDMMPIILPRSRTLAGTVRDGAGKPLAGVRVEARDWLTQSGFFVSGAYHWSLAPEPRTAVRTDASGRFVLAGTCDSAVCLRVGGDGFTTSTSGPLAAGESFDAVVASASVVTVRVIDAAGRPVPGVALRCHGPPFPSDQPSGYGDDSGRWRFTWYGEGPIEVHAQDPDYSETGGITLAQPVAQVDLPTKAPAPVAAAIGNIAPGAVAVRGRVVDPDGDKPVAAAWVRAVTPREAKSVDSFVLDGAARGPDAPRTGTDGSFVLHLMPGDYCLVAAGSNVGSAWRMHGRERNPTPLPIQVRVDQDMAGVELRLQPLVGMRGSVGKISLPRGCMVQFVPFRTNVSSATEWDFTQRFPLSTDGSFLADGLLARRYQLQLLVPRGFRQGLPDRVPLAVVDVTGAELKVDAAKALPAAVHGKVHGNVPATRLAVLSLPANDKNAMLFGCVHYWGPVCPLARDGSYRLSEPPGERALLVVDLWSGVVLARGSSTTVEPGSDRQQDLEVTALPLDVEARGVPAGAEPWLDIVVANANWPTGLGQMVEVGIDRQECGLGVALPREPKLIRLWLPAGETHLVLRERHAVRSDGTDVLADVRVDPATAAEGRIVLQATGTDRRNK